MAHGPLHMNGLLYYAPALLFALVLLVLLWFYATYRRYTKDLPRPPYQIPSIHPNLHALSDDRTTLVWIGHSTVYLNLQGVRILTDPVFSEQVGVPIVGNAWKIGPKRHTAPAISVDEVPAVDVILLSHAHLDHLDLPSLRKLANPSTQVITAPGTSHLLSRLSYGEVHELGGTSQLTLDNGVTITAIPVRHWGRRYPWNKDYSWTGYLIEYAGRQLVFAGDTAYTPAFRELAGDKNIDVMIMPIGAYSPDSFQNSHCTPEQAWAMFRDSGARFLIPVHHNTFVLSQEPVEEPLQRLLAAALDEQHRVVVHQHGEGFELPESTSPDEPQAQLR